MRPGLAQLVALAPPLRSLFCFLQVPRAVPALLSKGYRRPSWLEMPQTLRINRPLVLLDWNLGVGWGALGLKMSTEAPQTRLMGSNTGESASYCVKGISSLSRCSVRLPGRRTLKRKDFGESCELLFQVLNVKTGNTQRPFPLSKLTAILCCVYEMPFLCSRKRDGFA